MAVHEIIAGVDIGNSTTEAVLMNVHDGKSDFLSYALIPTTGVKGTRENKTGVIAALNQAAKDAGFTLAEIQKVFINEATPVISAKS